MSMNDTLLVECVRAHPELYDKRHAGFKYVGIKDSAWKFVAETMNASVRDCTARWTTLRERFVKEKRFLEQEGKSGAADSTRPEWPLYKIISFLTPHIRKRKTVENFSPYSLPVSTSSPTMLSTDEESLSRLSPGCLDKILDEEAVDDASAPSPVCISSAAAANMPCSTPTGCCKKRKVDETAEIFKETLAALNKSMATLSAPALSPPSSIDLNNPDVLIGKNVESCLRNMKDMRLRLKYRRKFRSLVQDCEEEAEVQHNVQEAQQVTSKTIDKSIQVHLTKPFRSEANQTEIKLVNRMTSTLKPHHHFNNNPSRLSKGHPSKPQDVSREENSLSTVSETKRIFAKYIASQVNLLPKSVCNLLMREIKDLVDSKRNSNSFSVVPQETSCDLKVTSLKSEMDIGEFVIQD